MKRLLQYALLLTASVFTLAAHAGQISLFEHANFQGRRVDLNGDTRSLSPLGFNDMVSSIVVNSGRWEVCVDDDYLGHCQIFTRGSYNQIGDLNDQISSVREVGRWSDRPRPDDRRGADNGNSFWDAAQAIAEAHDRAAGTYVPPPPPPGYGYAAPQQYAPQGYGAPVVMFSRENMRGRVLELRGDTPDFVDVGENDTMESMVIRSGNWEICVDNYYHGYCRVFGPGDYPRLPLVFSDAISSMRRVQ